MHRVKKPAMKSFLQKLGGDLKLLCFWDCKKWVHNKLNKYCYVGIFSVQGSIYWCLLVIMYWWYADTQVPSPLPPLLWCQKIQTLFQSVISHIKLHRFGIHFCINQVIPSILDWHVENLIVYVLDPLCWIVCNSYHLPLSCFNFFTID